jgi:hypothetical protein
VAERTVDGERQTEHLDSHCLACAKLDVFCRHGGTVDLRGWHLSTCGVFLKAAIEANRGEGQ